MLPRLALLALVTAASAFAAPLDRISGSVSPSVAVPLPADATLTVELLDDATPAARGTRLVRLALPTHGRQPPLAFELPYHPDDLRPGHRYLLRATLIEGGGEVLYAGTLPAFGEGQANMVLQRMQDAAPATPLENTYWKLAAVGGQPARVEPGEREAYLLLLAGRASGGSGCNKLMGSYTLGTRGELGIGPLASTRMACPPAMMAQEAALLDAYARTRAYRIDGESLSLLDGDAVLARFVMRALP